MKQEIILLGPPGCGKGTQAFILQSQLKIPHISTGNLLREEVANDTDLGKKVKAYLDKGQFAPDELIIALVENRLHQPDCRHGFILDGFPRTMIQAQKLDPVLTTKAVVIYFEIPDDALVKRLTGRLSCPKCGAVYHKDFSPPKQKGICDHCSTSLIQRSDDTKEVVLSRLDIYHQQTANLILFYKEKGWLHTVDATRPPKEVTQKMLSLIESEKGLLK